MAEEGKDITVETEDGGIEVEVVREKRSERPTLRGDTRSLDVKDDELRKYSDEVQDRIKKLRFAYHEERRIREQKERDLATSTDFTQRLYRENAELKRNVARGEQAVIHQAITRTDAEIAQAKQLAKQAHEAGSIDDFLTSNEKMARAVAEKERLHLLKDAPVEDAPPPAQAAPPPAPGQPPRDVRADAWFAKNTWWGKPGYEKQTRYLKGLHQDLFERNITSLGTPDVYWKTIEEELATLPGLENGNGNGHEPDEEPRAHTRPLAVAGGTRSAGSATAGRSRVIRLSESQVRLAHRLGITPEQYAAELVLQEERGEAKHG
jgi:hypothetical protein